MFRIPCPHCGWRNASEFRHGGERRARPDPQQATPQEWRGYLYARRNVAGWTTETWYHGFGCRKFVTVARHTVTNEVRPASDRTAGPDALGRPAAGGTAGREATGPGAAHPVGPGTDAGAPDGASA